MSYPRNVEEYIQASRRRWLWRNVVDILTVVLCCVAFVLLVVLSACADATAPRGDVGHYALVSVGGYALPASSNLGPYRGGSLELRADSTFVDVLIIGNVVDSVFGRYVVGADSIRMTPNDWTPYAVRRDGDEIRARWGEGIFLYRRD